MSLQSRLFRGDPKLEAAAVSDPAHVVPGARGPHVTKIQKALIELGVAALELDGIYGPATAAAVLAYKKSRNIINYAYQTQPDNIVGKMTVAALDRELARRDAAPPCRGCPDPVRSAGGPPPASDVAVAMRESKPQMPGILSVLFQLVRIGGKLGPHSFALVADTPKRANELLAPYGMRLAWIPGFSFEFPKKIRWNSTEDLADLRAAANVAMPGFEPALRVLVCPFRSVSDDTVDDATQNAISAGPAVGIPKFKNFIVLNANCLRADRGTLLHEMIHCTSDAGMLDSGHIGQQADSIFSWGANRTVLKEEHAHMLHKAPFSFGR